MNPGRNDGSRENREAWALESVFFPRVKRLGDITVLSEPVPMKQSLQRHHFLTVSHGFPQLQTTSFIAIISPTHSVLGKQPFCGTHILSLFSLALLVHSVPQTQYSPPYILPLSP